MVPNSLLSFRLGLNPILPITALPTPTPSCLLPQTQILSLLSAPPFHHEPAGIPRRRRNLAGVILQERAPTPRSTPASPQSQQRIAQDRETAASAASSRRPPPPPPSRAGSKPAATAGASDNLFRFPQSAPRHRQRLHGRRPAPHRPVRRRRSGRRRRRRRVAGGEAGLDREDEPVGDGESRSERRTRGDDVDVGRRRRGGWSISRRIIAGSGDLAADTAGVFLAGGGFADGVVFE